MKRIKSITITKDDKRFFIRVYRTNSPSNYNLWVSIFQPKVKTPLVGTTFRDDATNDRIIEWAKYALNWQDMQLYIK